ncbi:class I SAM-dependent methyltransferase [Candidatus Pseudothioglobus singularis]|nr:class I SAM-dependent methyltransferase [Candidatus Pseudothioglobus singularis]
MNSIIKISACRMCGNKNLERVIDLGEQYLTGVFPKTNMHSSLTKGPLKLVKCHGTNVCGLLQLEHSYDLDEMYGDNYGYRSGLNSNMVTHLNGKINEIIKRVELESGDLVIDIGSNDGTSLGFYPDDLLLVGIDPTASKFEKYYKSHVNFISDFFSEKLIKEKFPEKKAKVVTSFSMLYDLEKPLDFARDIASMLEPKTGIWVFEQSYMPLMLERVAFDTICHEHLEYYGLKQIAWLAEQSGLEIIDVELNDTNGGSFSVVAALKGSIYRSDVENIQRLINIEDEHSLDSLEPYYKFSEDIDKACFVLKEFIKNAKKDGKRICATGASTKGNVLLQYCGFSSKDIDTIAEVNSEKFGSLTPGSWIKIEDESTVVASEPDYLIVLPWHFKDFFEQNPKYIGQTLIFPLPKFEISKL